MSKPESRKAILASGTHIFVHGGPLNTCMSKQFGADQIVSMTTTTLRLEPQISKHAHVRQHIQQVLLVTHVEAIALCRRLDLVTHAMEGNEVELPLVFDVAVADPIPDGSDPIFWSTVVGEPQMEELIGYVGQIVFGNVAIVHAHDRRRGATSGTHACGPMLGPCTRHWQAEPGTERASGVASAQPL